MTLLDSVHRFNWDVGNERKSHDKHGVSQSEAEQIFFNDPLLALAAPRHSEHEARWHALGKTNEDRVLHITFTLRDGNKALRVISARDMHRKEKAVYEQAKP